MASTQENGNIVVPKESIALESRSQNDQTPGSAAYSSFATRITPTATNAPSNPMVFGFGMQNGGPLPTQHLSNRNIKLPVSVRGRIGKRMQFNEESKRLSLPSTNARLPLTSYGRRIIVKLPGGPRKVITPSLTRSSHDYRILSTASVKNSPFEVSHTAAYNVDNEEAPLEQFYTPVFQKILQQGIDIAKSAVTAIIMFGGTPYPGSHVPKLLIDAHSLATFHCSDTRMIAILGDSGEGKSSLINSLLHCPGVAKISDLGSACTTVITEYRQQKKGQTTPILIEAEYLTQDRYSNGIVLVDLPGPQDTSLARLQARQEYIMKSDHVFVLSKDIPGTNRQISERYHKRNFPTAAIFGGQLHDEKI
ncbi:hypothetical protein TSTA_063370 [Talaromyces stipitatus ATCC 10500]|uniref:G domain-containing protein n=1 Tax=Talaromyces stipitatus (strain ATCC 10500 / CBS 375.48 / QM 6759 / NRRL 1006) TaxID=441959 RepID=B8LYC7_TALSN|nr:uncharacterized protein TSTA_063370 [Talaromyces stipitatus ATCC 10500]EED22856.1 hypothetical protein TSTA_063370 [Talaromyces stipitatus ATCC 10500]